MSTAAQPALHPVHPEAVGFAEAWGAAWSRDPTSLMAYYTVDAVYRDVAMGVTAHGREAVARYQRHMSEFIADGEVVFVGSFHASSGFLTAPWTWAGTVAGPIRLVGGDLIELPSQRLSVEGVAVCRYDENGLIETHADYWDLASMLAPAGVSLTGARDRFDLDGASVVDNPKEQ